MRLRVTFQVEQPTTIPLNYQYPLASAVYRFLEDSNREYARFLHDQGYAPLAVEPDESPATGTTLPHRRFKLFTFSQLWAARSRISGDRLWLSPGPIYWQIASPVEQFLRELATGLLSAGVLRIGSQTVLIAGAETLPAPEFTSTMHFKCLSPIVVGVGEMSDGQRKTRYLRPKDPGWSERIGCNLLGKYAALHGGAPTDTRLALHFDPDYLATHKGTKLITYKDIQMVGAFAPFTLSGSPDLFRIGYECGLGEKNAGGCGMIEVVKSAAK